MNTVTRVRKLAGFEELAAMFDPEVHDALRGLIEGATHIVVYENLDLSSSWCGERTALKVGPGCGVRTLDKALRGHLGDLPSQRQYPIAYLEVANGAA